MSKIEQYGRQHEVFDATNKKHRKIFHEVLKYRTWGRSPIRFWLENEKNNLISQITEEMVRYYMVKEFGKLSPEEGEIMVGPGVRTRPNPTPYKRKVYEE